MVASNSLECNILIIDDEPAARYVVAGLLRAENCVTYEAQNGVEGLRMAREIKPRLVHVRLRRARFTQSRLGDARDTRGCGYLGKPHRPAKTQS